MSVSSLLLRSILLIWSLSALTSLVNAAAIANSDANGKLELPSNSSATSNDSFQTLPSSTSPNLYWPLESPVPTTDPGSEVLVLPVNTSALTAGQLSCNGRLYGRNFNLPSCLQVYHLMSSDNTPRIFGERGTGDYEAPLPFRYLSADGLCAVDLSHASGVISDTVAPGDLKEAARVLIDVCVAGKPSEGGLMTGLGQNKGLALRVVRYKPSVTCGPADTGPPWITCTHILDNMPADNQKRIFGPQNWANTTVALPASFTTQQRRCGLVVDGTEPGSVSDTSDWYKIWAAANAVNYMCVHGGKRGVAVGVGKHPSSKSSSFARACALCLNPWLRICEGERRLLHVELKDVATTANAPIAAS